VPVGLVLYAAMLFHPVNVFHQNFHCLKFLLFANLRNYKKLQLVIDFRVRPSVTISVFTFNLRYLHRVLKEEKNSELCCTREEAFLERV